MIKTTTCSLFMKKSKCIRQNDKRLLFQKIRRIKREFKTRKQIIFDENGDVKIDAEEVKEVKEV